MLTRIIGELRQASMIMRPCRRSSVEKRPFSFEYKRDTLCTRAGQTKARDIFAARKSLGKRCINIQEISSKIRLLQRLH